MMHAIVIGTDGPKADTAVAALWDAGFPSIFRIDDIGGAAALFADVHPGLVLLLPETALGTSAAELARVSELADAPVIVAGADVRQSLGCIGPVTSVDALPLAA